MLDICSAISVSAATTCTSAWYCFDWQTCINGKQIRFCSDIHNCKVPTNKPVTSQECSATDPVSNCKTDSDCGAGMICGGGNICYTPSSYADDKLPGGIKFVDVCTADSRKFGVGAVCLSANYTYKYDKTSDTRCQDYCTKLGKAVGKNTLLVGTTNMYDHQLPYHVQYHDPKYVDLRDTTVPFYPYCGRSNYYDYCCSCVALQDCGIDNCGFGCKPCANGKTCVDGKCALNPECGRTEDGKKIGDCTSQQVCIKGQCISNLCTPQGQKFYPAKVPSPVPAKTIYGCCSSLNYVPDDPNNIEAGGTCQMTSVFKGNCIDDGQKLYKYSNYQCCSETVFVPDDASNPQNGGTCKSTCLKSGEKVIGSAKCCSGLTNSNGVCKQVIVSSKPSTPILLCTKYKKLWNGSKCCAVGSYSNGTCCGDATFVKKLQRVGSDVYYKGYCKKKTAVPLNFLKNIQNQLASIIQAVNNIFKK